MIRSCIVAALYAVGCLAQTTAGTSGTMGPVTTSEVTYTATDAYVGSATCAHAVPYSNITQTILPSEPVPCLSTEYNTADGPGTNKNDWILQEEAGGGVGPFSTNATLQWGGQSSHTNNSQPRWDWCMVLGNCSGMTRHFNLGMIAGTRTNVANISVINSVATTFTVTPVNAGYWPQSADVSMSTPYVMIFPETGGEKILVTGQSGAQGSSYSVTASTRGYGGTTAASHTTAEYTWPEDTTGKGPWYPADFCDTAAAHGFVAANAGNGTVPGHSNPVIFDFGWSHGATDALAAALFGKALLSYAGCNAQYTSTAWIKGGVFLVSPMADYGVVEMLTTLAPNFPSPYNVTADGTEPGFALATAGPTSAGAATASSPTYSQSPNINGLGVTSPNAAFTQARLWSPGFCQPGNHGSCLVTPDADAKTVPIYVACGDGDQNVGCWQIWNWAYSAIGLNIHFLSLPTPSDHNAGSRTDVFPIVTLPGNCGGAQTVSSYFCWDGRVMQWMNQMLLAPYNTAPRGAMLTN